jgi:hypothetical protein
MNVRSVGIIGSDKKIHWMRTYPAGAGRNFAREMAFHVAKGEIYLLSSLENKRISRSLPLNNENSE